MRLGIDTAGPVVGLALWDGGRLVDAWSERVVRGADARLLPALAERIESRALDLVGVSTGPGAFTGLRVGVAIALGIAEARGVRVCPLSSLAVRAALVDHARVLSLLDARKGRLYAGWFDSSGMAPRSLGPEQDIEVNEVLDGVSPGFVAVGEGALVRAEAILAAGGRVVDEADRSPAAQVARLATQADALDPAEIVLRYIRPADAKKPQLGAPG